MLSAWLGGLVMEGLPESWLPACRETTMRDRETEPLPLDPQATARNSTPIKHDSTHAYSAKTAVRYCANTVIVALPGLAA